LFSSPSSSTDSKPTSPSSSTDSKPITEPKQDSKQEEEAEEGPRSYELVLTRLFELGLFSLAAYAIYSTYQYFADFPVPCQKYLSACLSILFFPSVLDLASLSQCGQDFRERSTNPGIVRIATQAKLVRFCFCLADGQLYNPIVLIVEQALDRYLQ
jgi:hypothetical protein